MRLLEIKDPDNIKLRGPFFDAQIPKYAILSHTWGSPDEELTFQAMDDISPHKHKKGWQKIESFCALAREAGHQYAWVDTVCIDKTSSAELSEAINSMYKWYQNAEICYVFLEDVDSTDIWDIKHCRWFTRGWTLQELIAPPQVVFFNKSWENLGSLRKKRVALRVERNTGINFNILYGRYPIKSQSIAYRMSWAANRATSRSEDMAYCLLGIFGVNIPLLYGEGGRKAFMRLQEEILRTSDDQSIFAWFTDLSPSPSSSGYFSLLAPSPACFKDSNCFIPARLEEGGTEIIQPVTSRGVELDAMMNTEGSRIILKCRSLFRPSLFTIPIERLRSSGNEYARLPFTSTDRSVAFADVDFRRAYSMRKQIFVRNNVCDEDYEHQYRINYMEIIGLPSWESGYRVARWWPTGSYDPSRSTITASPFPNTMYGAFLYFSTSSITNSFHETPPFIVGLFADYEPKLPNARPFGPDTIRVFCRVTFSMLTTTFHDLTQPYDVESLVSVLDQLPGAVESTRHQGLDVWKLDDNNYVRILIDKNHPLKLDSIRVAGIFAGSNWERDIVTESWGYTVRRGSSSSLNVSLTRTIAPPLKGRTY